jgi:hypothetical protein
MAAIILVVVLWDIVDLPLGRSAAILMEEPDDFYPSPFEEDAARAKQGLNIQKQRSKVRIGQNR